MKHECRMCPKPCRIEVCDPERQTPTGCLFYFKTSHWREIPDPDPSTKVNGIMEAWTEYHDLLGTPGGVPWEKVKKARLHIARAIVAEIGAVREKVEGNVRCFARIQGSELNQDLRTLERKVKDLQKHLDGHDLDFVSNNMDHEDLERNVESLGNKLRDYHRSLRQQVEQVDYDFRYHLAATKALDPDHPQPSGSAVAQAPDSKGVMHDLIERRSVLETPNVEMVFLFKNRYGNFVGYTSKEPQAEYKKPRRSEDGTWVAVPSDVTFSFNLPATGTTGRGK